jgi:hypothetical protein
MSAGHPRGDTPIGVQPSAERREMQAPSVGSPEGWREEFRAWNGQVEKVVFCTLLKQRLIENFLAGDPDIQEQRATYLEMCDA